MPHRSFCARCNRPNSKGSELCRWCANAANSERHHRPTGHRPAGLAEHVVAAIRDADAAVPDAVLAWRFGIGVRLIARIRGAS